MSNRLFFTVPLVLMGVLSGCIPKGDDTDDKLRAWYADSFSAKAGFLTPEKIDELIANMPEEKKRLLLRQISEVKSSNEIKAQQELLANQGSQSTQKKAQLVIKDYAQSLSCTASSKSPSNDSIKSSNAIKDSQLALLGKIVSKSDQNFAREKNCDLTTIAYNKCKDTFDKYDCVQGYIYSTLLYDKDADAIRMEYSVKRHIDDSIREAAERDRANALMRKAEQLASNETKLNADLYWYTGQINERKLKLTKVQQGSKEYAELSKEIDYLNNELVPLNLAQELIKQRQQAADNKAAQQREYQQRQAQQAQLEYQRKQLELQRQQAEALEEANNPLSLQNRVKSLEDMNRRNKPVNCSTVGGVTTCF